MTRLAHFSDIHLNIRPAGWTLRDRLTKRIFGWSNLYVMGRAKRFRHAPRVLEALRREFETHSFDHLIFSGDSCMLAFDAEFERAAQSLPLTQWPGIAVPGNHDYYLPSVVTNRRFEHYFAPWLKGQRMDDEHIYPFAQKVGHLWLIAVNSSRPNFWNWDASGAVGPQQRERLRQLLATLEPGPRILVTHYPALMENGHPEPFWHQLRDWREMLEVAAQGGISLWLNGHRHHGYLCNPTIDMPFPLICAGSTTQTNRWSYNDYHIEGTHLTAVRRQYHFEDERFVDWQRFELDLPVASMETPPS